MANHDISLNDYDIGQHLGGGKFGQVFIGTHKIQMRKLL